MRFGLPERNQRYHAWSTLAYSILFLLVLFHVGIGQEHPSGPPLKSIKVVMDNNYPPFVFLDDSGKLVGTLIDQWKLWEKKTGMKAMIHGTDWSEARRRMDAGEFDVIDTIFINEERSKRYDFSKPYASIEVPIYFRKEIAGIVDTNTLKGFVVAIKSGDMAVDFLKNKGVANLQEFSSYESIIRAAKDRRTAVFVVDKPAAEYFLHKMNIHGEFHHTKSLYTGELHRAVKKGNKALLNAIEDGFSRISAEEHKGINKKWYGTRTIIPGYLQYVGIAAGAIVVPIILLLVWNVTLRKRVEQRTGELKRETEQLAQSTKALKESEDLLYCMTTAAFDAIITIDEQGCISYWNKAAEAMFGYSREEIHGRDLHAILAPGHYQDLIRAGLARFHATGEGSALNRIMEVTALNKNGHEFPVELSVAPLLIKDRRHALGIIRDITRRRKIEENLRESEERWRLFMEYNPIHVFFKDENIRCLQLSKNFEQMIGRPVEELIGKTMYDIFPPDLAKSMIEDDMKVLRDGIPVEVDEELNGRYYTTMKFPITRQGKPTLLAGFTIDITHRKEAEAEKAHLESQLRQAQKMEAIGTLAGGIAHDFNNILTVLIGFGSLLQAKMDDDDPRKAYVKQMLTSSERAAHLTRSLLTFSRKQQIDLKPREANSIVKDTVQILGQLLTEDIALKTALTAENTTIMADGVQVDHVLINLATNARDAMPQGGTLSIETQVVELDDRFIRTHGYGKLGTYVRIAVSDTGIGMDGNIQEHIFEPFFTTKGVGKGTGLGLSSVYGTIKQHSGYITVSSSPGHGTTFYLFFPLADTNEAPEPAQAKQVSGGHETILIVEDDPGVRELISETLREHGYKTIEAGDGEEAIRMFTAASDTIDLVITDVIMPKKNGREVYKEITGINPHIKVLFTSGYADDTIFDRGMHEASFDFIPKPVLPDDLLLKIRKVLGA